MVPTAGVGLDTLAPTAIQQHGALWGSIPGVGVIPVVLRRGSGGFLVMLKLCLQPLRREKASSRRFVPDRPDRSCRRCLTSEV